MQVTQTQADGLKRAFKVVLPAATISSKVDSKLEDVRKTMALPGFRPGKVPMGVLKQRFGKAVLGDVLQEAVSEGAKQAIESNQLKLALQPKIDIAAFDDGKDLEFSLEVEVKPEFEIQDFAGISLEKLIADVDDARIDAALKRMAEQQKTFTKAERAAETGDAVLIDFTGRKDGVAFVGGTAKDFQLVLGSGSFIPGFEDQLVGANAGETRMVKVTFPEGYGNKDLAGAQAEFEVVVNEVRQANVPAADEAFAKAMGMQDLMELRGIVRGQLEKEYAGQTRAKLKRSLLDQLAASYSFVVPAGLVQLEFDGIWQEVERDMQVSGRTWTDGGPGKTEDDAKAEFRAIAERRVRLGLLLAEIGDRNNLTVKPEELNRAVIDQARRYPGQERAIIDYFQNNPEMLAHLRAPLLEDKVIDFILEIAKVSERRVPIDELLRDPEDSAAA